MTGAICFYRLDEQGQPVPEPDITRWAIWFETSDCTVAKTIMDGVVVSTVFLGLDSGQGMLWETMVFGPDQQNIGPWRDCVIRYMSREQALEGHDAVVAIIAGGTGPEGVKALVQKVDHDGS